MPDNVHDQRAPRMQQSPPARFRRLVVVSYRLPFKTAEREGGTFYEQSSGGLVSAMSALSEKIAAEGGPELFRHIIWVGKGEAGLRDENHPRKNLFLKLLNSFLPRRTGKEGTGAHQHLQPQTADRYQLVPVVIDDAINEKYYGGFCNDLLWPLFHYFPSLVVHDESYFESYRTANRIFAEKIKSIIRPDDLIWVHDYQLFLLPDLIRKDFPLANISFFLHIPFPTFEIFRGIPRRWCDAIIRGMLGADLVGFHTYDYSQYFLRTVSRILGYEITMNSVTVDERVVKVDAYPVGIDFKKFNDAARSAKEVSVEREKTLASLAGKKLIFSVDRLDYSKGLLQRLEAFEYFLDVYPEWKEKIVFNMVVIPSRDTIAQYQNMKRDIDTAVGRINARYATMEWRPIVYQYKRLSFSEMVALYDVSIVGLITPIRDGMNLVAKEYVACQVTEKGVLILSEMAGAAAELSETLLINPADKIEVAEAINKALTMPLRDRAVIVARMQKRIKDYTIFTWAREIMDGMETIKKEQDVRRVTLISPAVESTIVSRYKAADRRVLFLDYDGTLVPFSKVPELAVPGSRTIKQLQELSEKPGNAVVLISGRDKNFLEEWFGSSSVHLIAEHGAFQKSPDAEWLCTIDPDQTWKAVFIPVFQRYTDRCNGSFIEEKFSSLAWHYRNAPLEVGQLKAKELREELRTLAAHENKLQVLEGEMVVEIKRSGYDKGSAALKFISNTPYDFIMAIGDDRTDEDIFRSLPPEAITIKIGITTSLAKYNLANQGDVSHIIDRLIKG
ncbi:MAG: bifunctional alpha,alpha-trehalose-phosphate synthase (UDP-forming)/trehalose-phosphatase [Chitinispirillaceae bacterium]|nr:bifunctional alpha,alpha-trehalose-phosphate synthase (UDP-forming)/trehalose-phosphatase [Chitinispirillaceae bacterium]